MFLNSIRQWENEELDELAKHVVFVCHEEWDGRHLWRSRARRHGIPFRTDCMVDHEDIGSAGRSKFTSLVELVRDGPRIDDWPR